uniref:Ubiquitin-like protease family profile domain-containing protein n=1 Tax=Triticum urartu TaxID=4572 RepID=A0A8R7JWQ6_TRIUA
MIEKLNKTGVSYKPSNLEEDEENLYGGSDESSNDGGRPKKEFVYQKDDSDRFRTPSKMNLQKDDDRVDVTSRGNTPFYCTPEYWDSFKGDMDDPIQVPEVSDEKAATSLETDEIASHASLGSQGVQEEVEEVTSRRKSKGSQHVKSPYVVPKPNKRAKRSVKGKLFQNGGVNKSGDEYDVVKASIKYVRAHEHSQKHAKTEIFNDGMEEGLTVRRACQIINHEWLSGDVINAYSSFLVDKVNDDRFMLTTWRIHWLLHIRSGKKTAGNDYVAESHSNGPVNRCEDEYFKKSKTYIPLNKQNNHWITVVMHSGKREFQVFDSLMTEKLDSVTRELVEDLRKQLAEDIQEANATGIVNYPDVSNWPIKTYDMPKQHDGNSCGIFLFRCFQYWDGDKWTGLFSQSSIDDSRELMIAQLIFLERNKLDEVKNKVIRISKKKK